MKLYIQNKRFVLYTMCFLLFITFCSLSSCKKYLDEKPSQKLTVPSTIKDLELVLDNYDKFNSNYRSIGEVAADNYYLLPNTWASVTEAHRNFYIWAPYDNITSEWGPSYQKILYCNTILEVLSNIKNQPEDQERWNNIKGSALFLRAYNFYDLSQLFCAGYDKNTASQDLGIPLRLSSNTDVVSVRATVQQTYDQIINDLKASVDYLPDTSIVKYHPSKAAVFGTLARIYMIMQDYTNAKVYADLCLGLYSRLMDYNNSPFVNSSSPAPITRWSDEVIFDAISSQSTALIQSRAKVDTNLQRSYDTSDLRRNVFFKINSDGTWAFKGNYTGLSNASLFRGVATDEIYLTRAECFARSGNTVDALADLNAVIMNRWADNGTWSAFSTSDADTALNWILTERRKELLYRGIRWSDLRRLNKEQRFAITLVRNLDAQVYTLPPNSARYVFLIDRSVIQLSGMPQNP